MLATKAAARCRFVQGMVPAANSALLTCHRRIHRISKSRPSPHGTSTHRLRALDEACRAGYQPGDAKSTSRFLDSNKAFHVEIARATGNERLADAVEQLLDEMTRLLHLGLGLRNRSQEMLREHRALVK